MRRLLAVGAPVVLAFVTGGTAVAQERADTARVHQVRPGDTLWDLARQYLADPFLWPRIYDANQGEVENPHWIFPRERLVIPGLAPSAAQAPGAVGWTAAPEQQPRTVFFQRATIEGREVIGADVVNSPAVAAGEYYGAGLLTPDDQVRPVGQLTEVLSPTVLPVDPAIHALPYQIVYMAIRAPGAVRPGDLLHLVRPGRLVQPFGRIFEFTGIARVTEVDGGTATLEVQELFDAVAVGNFAVPLEEFAVPVGVRPQPAAPGVWGQIVAFLVPQPLYSENDVAFIDLGSDAGMTEGDIVEAVLPEEQREWGVRPEVVVARMQVVRVAQGTSAVQVISVEHPAIETGLRVRVVAKMPST